MKTLIFMEERFCNDWKQLFYVTSQSRFLWNKSRDKNWCHSDCWIVNCCKCVIRINFLYLKAGRCHIIHITLLYCHFIFSLILQKWCHIHIFMHKVLHLKDELFFPCGKVVTRGMHTTLLFGGSVRCLPHTALRGGCMIS